MNKCEVCGKDYKQPRSNNRKYCSKKCNVVAYEKRNPRKRLLQRAQYRATRTQREFNLTLDDIPEIPTHCPVLGIELKTRNGRSGLYPDSISLNRIDPSRGYVKGNIEIISQRANHLLSNATIEELEKVLKHASRSS